MPGDEEGKSFNCSSANDLMKVVPVGIWCHIFTCHPLLSTSSLNKNKNVAYFKIRHLILHDENVED